MEAYLNDEQIPHERIATSLHRATLDIKVTPVLCGSSFKNKGVQPLLDAIVELLAVAARRPAREGHRAPGEGQRRRGPRGRAPGGRRRAVRGAGVQGDGRSLRRQADLLSRLLGQARLRRAGPELDQRAHRAHRAPADDAREPPRGDRGGLRGRHRRRRRPEADRHRRHALRARRTDLARDDRVPGAGDRRRDRAEDQGRPGEALRIARAAGRGGPDLPGADATTRPARR